MGVAWADWLVSAVADVRTTGRKVRGRLAFFWRV